MSIREAIKEKRKNIPGTIYLLHFSRPFAHARHYIGWTTDLEKRLATHRAGDGSRLLRAVVKSGITFEVARLWLEKTRDFERKLHRRKDTRKMCPICKASRRDHVTNENK